MKLIIRADDFGYTDIYNAGVEYAINNGIVTHLDIMLDTPGTDNALEIAKKYPWLSLGWHAHMWGKPVLGPDKVPSMVNEEGRFKWRKNKKLQLEINFDEAVAEYTAQMEKCVRIYGKAVDVADVRTDSISEKAKEVVINRFGIVHNHFSQYAPEAGKRIPIQEKYKSLNIYHDVFDTPMIGTLMKDIDKFETCYNPVERIMSLDLEKYKDATVLLAFHPGYLDSYILSESTCTISRVKDVEALCDFRLKKWIIDNEIELVNQRDAIFGTREYQNHLDVIGSELSINRIKGLIK